MPAGFKRCDHIEILGTPSTARAFEEGGNKGSTDDSRRSGPLPRMASGSLSLATRGIDRESSGPSRTSDGGLFNTMDAVHSDPSHAQGGCRTRDVPSLRHCGSAWHHRHDLITKLDYDQNFFEFSGLGPFCSEMISRLRTRSIADRTTMRTQAWPCRLVQLFFIGGSTWQV